MDTSSVSPVVCGLFRTLDHISRLAGPDKRDRRNRNCDSEISRHEHLIAASILITVQTIVNIQASAIKNPSISYIMYFYFCLPTNFTVLSLH